MLSELGQYVDKDDDNDNNSSKKSHNNAAPKEENDDETTSAFDNYIKVHLPKKKKNITQTNIFIYLLCNQSQTN